MKSGAILYRNNLIIMITTKPYFKLFITSGTIQFMLLKNSLVDNPSASFIRMLDANQCRLIVRIYPLHHDYIYLN